MKRGFFLLPLMLLTVANIGLAYRAHQVRDEVAALVAQSRGNIDGAQALLDLARKVAAELPEHTCGDVILPGEQCVFVARAVRPRPDRL
jgi:hypothetical protein